MMSTSENRSSNIKPLNGDARWLAYDAYIFDIDGTLLNGRDRVHYNSFQSALREVYGCQRDISEVPLHGNTDIGILRATTRLGGIEDSVFEARLQEALAWMRASTAKNVAGFRAEACPSIPAMLAILHERGKLLGVATGNLEEVGWPKLAAAGLKHYFKFGCFSDHHEQRADIFRNAAAEARRRLGPDASVCFIGDTPNDIDAAQRNHCPVIAVATGIHTYETLHALSPDFCLRSCDELFTA
jgi:phosphoglycolate phosphatase-like HAD superfamily hydrolase